ncbi:MAG TPA: hypothetical protein VJB35_00670 [Candidatus Nanoarchaeia archaeon]|nr:hypothetical protein [Candidatus Nanoarchaeia archaeon]
MNKWLEIIVGLICLTAVTYIGGMNLLGMGTAAIELLKGGIMWILIFAGLLFIILGISDLKE